MSENAKQFESRALEYANRYPNGVTYGDGDLPWWAGELASRDQEISELRETLQNAGDRKRLEAELDEAELKAWDSLGRYKFQMFGYWAAIWVHLNRIGEFKRPNPWSYVVRDAQRNADSLTEARKRRESGS